MCGHEGISDQVYHPVLQIVVARRDEAALFFSLGHVIWKTRPLNDCSSGSGMEA